MGFFSDLISKIFGKKEQYPQVDYANFQLTIDYADDGITINGKKITLLADFGEFAFLGEPRKIKTKAGINYAWDELGVHCYTNDNKVRGFGVAMNKGEVDVETNPRNLYKGTLTINGRDWKTEVDKGEQTEVLTLLRIGNYSVAAEYCEFMDNSKYSVVEIQLYSA